jgi:hypothetical protein
MNETTSEQNKFECVKLTVHFIYSFVLAHKNNKTEEDEPIDIDKLVEISDGFFTKGTPLAEYDNHYRGIAQHLNLKEHFAFKKLNMITATVLNNKVESFKIQINPLLRIFPSGAILDFTVILDRTEEPYGNVSMDEIHAVLHLVQQLTKKSPPSKLKLSEGKPVRLYSLFDDEVTSLVKKYDNAQYKITWFDKPYIEYNQNESGYTESQSPWVVTIAQVKGETAKAFCKSRMEAENSAEDRNEQIKKYANDVSSILLRTVHGTDFEFESRYENLGTPNGSLLQNLNLDARLHVAACNRSILCIHNCKDNVEQPHKYFIPDLLELCGMLRAKWHTLTILNKYFDKILGELLESNRLPPERIVYKIINMRTWLARLFEDPELYRISGDALSNISIRLKRIFCEKLLRRNLLDKSELIERIQSGIVKLSWIDARNNLRTRLDGDE